MGGGFKLHIYKPHSEIMKNIITGTDVYDFSYNNVVIGILNREDKIYS